MDIEIYNLSEVTSTNDYARELLSQNNLVLVSALNQTEGRGRKGNNWFGSYGKNLYISFGIKHQNTISPNQLASLQAMSALIVKKALRTVTNSDIFYIKYPNDIYAKDANGFKKIAGILLEHNFSGSVCINTIIGIGINVLEDNFPIELANNATSLKMLNLVGDNKNNLLKPENSISEIQNGLIDYFNLYFNIFANGDTIHIFNEWKEELNIIGKEAFILEKGQYFEIIELLDDCRLRAYSKTNNEEIIIDNGNSIRYKLD
ncbi:biotin--[acetyl-CoA-carboxylase] ligase [bacterium]|nr:biotin--[acetyl-CoA-carboxylase] ligase [bacterium]